MNIQLFEFKISDKVILLKSQNFTLNLFFYIFSIASFIHKRSNVFIAKSIPTEIVEIVDK
jgi:hypothetical protein